MVTRLAHPRLHVRLGGAHPLGASQHQKVVVIDDHVAFAGGLDLTVGRWDTPEPARLDPFCLVNYAAGLARVPVRMFFVGTVAVSH